VKKGNSLLSGLLRGGNPNSTNIEELEIRKPIDSK
jgi:hypothetical protein